jgi:hypothetical protein
MRSLALAVILVSAAATSAVSADSAVLRSLKRLDPTERLEQLCDYTAMLHIRKEGHHYRPDRAIADAVAVPKLKTDSIEASGGAFRSRGHWYEMSYSCSASPDHMRVLSFNLKIGKEIPESRWAAYGLWQ